MQIIIMVVIMIVVIVLQLIMGQLLGFGLAMGLGVGNGWELLVMPLGNTLGVWGVGALAARLQGTFAARPYGVRLLGAAVGSAIGVGLILVTPPFGFGQLLLPLLGALFGYYGAGALR